MEIKTLNKDTFKDYVAMIERNSYSHNPNWKGCYCYFYHNKISIQDWIRRTSIDNKEASYQAMMNHELFGFLLYENDECIGWVNANDQTYYYRLEDELSMFKDKKSATTMCYIIDERYRNQGCARKLLAHAINYYKEKGYDQMVAAPVISDMDKSLHYHGSIHMYEEQGYQHYQTFGDVYVMIKNLK
jgi:GNAT superfamily N-acetyltransferase